MTNKKGVATKAGDKKVAVKEGIINITTKASKDGLKRMLNHEAERRGVGLRHFCGSILEEALEKRYAYDKPLKKPLPSKGGEAINIVVSNEEIKKKLQEWAAERHRALGKHCAFLLEKWLEIEGIQEEREK